MGGARKRAAYYILSGKRKGIVGVYFQSHEGEVFFQAIMSNNNKHKTQKPTAKQIINLQEVEPTPPPTQDKN